MELSCSNIKNIVIFLETETLKEILYISGNGKPKTCFIFQEAQAPKKFIKIHTGNLFIFQGMKLSSSKIKKFFLFQEMELSSCNIKKMSYILSHESSHISGSENSKITIYISGNGNPEIFKNFFLYFVIFIFPCSKNNKYPLLKRNIFLQHGNYFS